MKRPYVQFQVRSRADVWVVLVIVYVVILVALAVKVALYVVAELAALPLVRPSF